MFGMLASLEPTWPDGLSPYGNIQGDLGGE